VSVHLVRGDDPILRDQAVGHLVDELLGDADRTMALEDFTIPARGMAEGDATGADARIAVVDAVLNAAMTLPFGADRRVVVLREIGLLAAGEVAPIVQYAAEPSESTELVLVAGGGRTAKAIDDVVKKHGAAHAPDATKPADVLARELDDAGIELRADAATALLAHVGSDAGLVPGLVDTLAAAYGPGAVLGVDEVSPYLVGQGTVPVWDLTNAIEKGDVATALEVLQRMLTVTSPTQPAADHPLRILGLLHSQYRKLLVLDDPAVRTAEDAASALGGRTSPNAARFRLRQARALGTDGLRQAFDHLARADLDIKGERAIPQDLVMQLLVARLAGLNARAGAASSGGGKGRGSSRAGARGGGGGRQKG
jgi:DNA polymerase-3 subunit delta